jgi:hypothetical protein
MNNAAQIFDFFRTFASVAAIIVSLASLYFARKSWMRSNRPIVTAYLAEFAIGNISSPFNLVVVNTGNRPALNVRMICEPEELLKLVDDRDTHSLEHFVSTFSKEARLSVLKNGEEITTWFGMITKDPMRATLRHGSSGKITIAYSDLDGNDYSHDLELYVWARSGFGGSSWESKE